MGRLNWYWNRLQNMSAAEIIYRTKNIFEARFQRLGFGVAKHLPPKITSKSSVTIFTCAATIESTPYVEAADKVMRGYLDIFSIDKVKLGLIPDWNRDPKTGTVAPLEFGKTLDYRNNALVGDIKYLWEPNRHLQLVVLGQAYCLTKETKYLEAIQSQLESWFDQCPYLIGPNWTSSLESGIRLINWCILWDLIGGEDSPLFKNNESNSFKEKWLTSIYQHMHFINGHFSRFSSANNHLIGEAAGLFIASVKWPYWKNTMKWQLKAYKIITNEAMLQNCPDGVNREQAISYQQFVLDFLLFACLIGEKNDIKFSQIFWDRIEAMLIYLASIMDVNGNIPMIGDADDGYAVKLSQETDFCPYNSLLATGAIIFNRPEFKKKAARLDDKTKWLLGKEAEEKFTAIDSSTAKLPINQQFPDGGYYILGTGFETEAEIKLIVDAGPLGYTSIAAHGHADALAFTLSIAGHEMLIDPGTYAYHTQKIWRDYFRGTSAHNTARIDGMDQSVIGGNFMWLKSATATCEHWAPGIKFDHFTGVHDGYKRLNDPVIHKRDIKFDKVGKIFNVVDSFSCQKNHLIERFWHFSEECKVEVNEEGVITAINKGKRIKLKPLFSHVDTKIYTGDSDKPLGWVSRRFDLKVATTTVVWSSQINKNIDLGTEIVCELL